MKTLFFLLCALAQFSVSAMDQKNHSFIHHNAKENIIIAYSIDEFKRCYKRTTLIKDMKNNNVDVRYTIQNKYDNMAPDNYDDMAPEFDAPVDGYYRDKEELLKKRIEEFEKTLHK